MPRVTADQLVVDFPIYGAKARSLKQSVIRAATGGLLARDPSDHVVVRALDHVSFDFRDGDRIGLVGHNGSGKSTLLRVIAGAYQPVNGRIEVEGRIASMLSITLGMDPEATGYENIYLRGAVMGLRRHEIDPLVDEICEFSELGDYIHMPMRTYSSGMSIRLAFAISTSVRADIVLMDEWLSAGDAEFSAKAQERLNHLVDRATILVLASHSPDVIRANCNKILQLQHGRVVSQVAGSFKPRKTNSMASVATQSDAAITAHPEITIEERLRVWALRGQPSYDENNLTTWHQSVDFLDEPRFIAAYERGMSSGHFFLGRGADKQDLNIRWRLAIYCWGARHASHLTGDFVDCGTNTGIFALTACEYIGFNSTGKNFWLFDTFEGIPREQMSEMEAVLGRVEENARWYPGTYEIAKKNFSRYPKAKVVKGKVPASLETVEIPSVAYLCLDMNIAYPEIAALDYFWPRIVTGGIVICDNYGWAPYREQKLAIDEWATKHDVEVMMLPTGQGLLLKP